MYVVTGTSLHSPVGNHLRKLSLGHFPGKSAWQKEPWILNNPHCSSKYDMSAAILFPFPRHIHHFLMKSKFSEGVMKLLNISVVWSLHWLVGAAASLLSYSCWWHNFSLPDLCEHWFWTKFSPRLFLPSVQVYKPISFPTQTQYSIYTRHTSYYCSRCRFISVIPPGIARETDK